MSAYQVIEQFKAFVAEQPPETVINHSTWSSCALGEFVRVVEPLNEGHQPITSGGMANRFNEVYGHDAYMLLGNGGRAGSYFSPDFEKSVSMANYGELSAWLNSLEPVVKSV